MKLINITMCSFLVLSIEKLFSHGSDLYKLIMVHHIKEIHNDGERLFLNTHPDADIDEFTEEKRSALCREGIKHILKFNLQGFKRNDNFLKESSAGTFKVYAVVVLGTNIPVNRVTILPAFKCLTNPATYIHLGFAKDNKLQKIFQVIYLAGRPRRILFDLIMYEMQLIEDIVEVNVTEMDESRHIFTELPEFDTDELSEMQRFQICEKAMQAILPLDIKLLADTRINSNKFYTVTLMAYEYLIKDMKIKRINEAFECPTEPKVYITVRQGKTRDVMKLLAMIKAGDDYQTTKHVQKMGAVSGQEVAESFYLQIREANPNTKKIQIIDLQTQQALCKTIFVNPVLQKYVKTRHYLIRGMDDVQWHAHTISPSDIYKELRSENPNLRKRLYKSSDSILFPGEDVCVLAGTESIDISVPETEEKVQENVFVCLTEQKSGAIKEYFISNEYNMNTRNSSEGYIAGRFIFQQNPSDSNKMEILALAEEYAEASELTNIELLYLEERKNYEPAKVDVDDPLCQLNALAKSRLCTIVFDHFMVTKRPVPLHQNLGCAKNLITFTTESGKEATNGKLYYEYMIPCYISTHPKGEDQVMYYLSRPLSPSYSNTVFTLFRSSTDANVIFWSLYNDLRIGSFFMEK